MNQPSPENPAIEQPAADQSAADPSVPDPSVPSTKSADSKKSSSSTFRAAMVVAITAFVMVVLWYTEVDLVKIRQRFGIIAPLVSVPVQAVVAATPFPSDVIVIANGAVYGYSHGVIYSYIGWFIGAMLEFYVVRSLKPAVAPEETLEKVPKWLRRFPGQSPVFLIVGRQIPWGGAHITIVGGVMAGVSWRRFVICTAIAIVPGALLLPAIGANLL